MHRAFVVNQSAVAASYFSAPGMEAPRLSIASFNTTARANSWCEVLWRIDGCGQITERVKESTDRRTEGTMETWKDWKMWPKSMGVGDDAEQTRSVPEVCGVRTFVPLEKVSTDTCPLGQPAPDRCPLSNNPIFWLPISCSCRPHLLILRDSKTSAQILTGSWDAIQIIFLVTYFITTNS